MNVTRKLNHDMPPIFMRRNIILTSIDQDRNDKLAIFSLGFFSGDEATFERQRQEIRGQWGLGERRPWKRS